MSIHSGVHLDDRSVIEPHNCSTITPGHGYLRLRPLAECYSIASVIHAQAPELRRLAAACLALADELDPPAPTYDAAHNAAVLRGYGYVNDAHDRRMGEPA